MGAAWEWRGFRSGAGEVDIAEMAAVAAASLGMSYSGEVRCEHDTYLVLEGVRHNLKIRQEALEIKVLVERLAGGLSLWEDKEVWPFPFSGGQIERLAGWVKGLHPDALASPHSAAELIRLLRRQVPGLSVVSIAKQRVRLDNGRARLEFADLSFPGDLRFLSCCIDGYELDAVKDLVRRSRLRLSTRSFSYVDLIREALWWYPNLGQDVAAG